MADEQTMAAVSHWKPRFVANGVPLHDFEATAASVSEWKDWCAAWVELGRRHEALAEEALASGHQLTAGEHLTRASRCYHFGKFVFVEHFDEMRAAHELAVAAYDRALPFLRPPGERVAVPYGAYQLHGILRVPDTGQPPPVVLMVSGLDSTKEEMGAYEEHLLQRGLATFAFDGPGQGEAEYSLPMRHDFEVPVAAVIDHLEGLPAVDSDRIGIYGVSLGGHYVVRATAFEPRIRACVSVSGSYRVADSWADRPRMNRASYRVRAHLETEEEAATFVERFDLDGVAGKVSVPLYLVAGTRDRLTPHTAAERIAAEATGPTVLDVVEGGNHVVNNLPYRYRSQVADWLVDTLG
jgi:dienelactone hydrolase